LPKMINAFYDYFFIFSKKVNNWKVLHWNKKSP
jgi:hypothetical protein